jgi:hypothetical protein
LSNKYTYSAPYTEEQLFELYITKNMSQAEIGNMFGVSQHKVFKDLKRMNINSRKATKRNQFGENNSSWKGGRTLVNYKTPYGHRFLSDRNEDKGYYMVRMPDHPNSGKNGYVFEHIAIALKASNRDKLEPFECVHHINFVRTDNDPTNLLICAKDKHREYHGKLENVVGELLDRKIVEFDSELGYFIK